MNEWEARKLLLCSEVGKVSKTAAGRLTQRSFPTRMVKQAG